MTAPAPHSPAKGRPFMLDPLFASVSNLHGVGEKTLPPLRKLIDGERIFDLLCHRPIDLIDRRATPKLEDAKAGRIATLKLRVDGYTRPERKGQPFRVRCSDDSGFIELVFFHGRAEWWEKKLPVGDIVAVSGLIESFHGGKQMAHPDWIGIPDKIDEIARLETVYPMTQGVNHRLLQKAMPVAVQRIPKLPEWLDPSLMKREQWPDFRAALTALHTPQSAQDIAPESINRKRLAYDEMLATQLALALVRHHQRTRKGQAMKGDPDLINRFLKTLPFELTGAQARALAEIDADMGSAARMVRLLQGDVGSGKTVVAARAMLNAISNGKQAALMAPTEILARQHAHGLTELFTQIGIRCIALTGRDKGKSRDLILKQIADGHAQIIIGTHALFQDSIRFHDLGLVVVDEQHRFGVHQRLKLSEKGQGTDLLVMTATPIPRTLTLTAYGDMDVSRLDEKPPGRKPIDTRLIAIDRIEDMIASARRALAEGRRIYWVCPLVEESETLDLAAAEERYDVLVHYFGAERIGLVHGRMKPAEKDAVMQAFAQGQKQILVATTVIEVGVNVPEATIMVIEHAERFGLAQLHQLRGRVGRGAEKSFCFLLYSTPLSETGKARLATMRETEDGFIIAEKDLELRGSGEILGTRQSGMEAYKLADLSVHKDLLLMARDDARLMIANDPALQSERGQALRHLLYLFERDQGIAYLRSG